MPTETYRCCGKPSGACQANDHAGHGPYFAFTTKVSDKTRTVQLRAGTRLDKFQREVNTYKQFRALCDKLIEVNGSICEARPELIEEEEERALNKNLAEVIQEEAAGEIGRIVTRVLARRPDASLDLEAIEMALRASMHQLGGAILEKLLDADSGHRGPRVPCGKGHAVVGQSRLPEPEFAMGYGRFRCALGRHGALTVEARR